jgi:anthranilate phosphoribosyltransferase
MSAPAFSPAGPPPWFAPTLAAVMDRRDLDPMSMCTLMHGLIDAACDDAAAAALLTALRMKGETADELAAAAAVLREYMRPFDAGRADFLDTCGTGGDGCDTFNISTAAALVAAAAGAPVVKHGNRAASGRCGSADVLAALGVSIEGATRAARRCLDRTGMAFCFAPHFHPALQRLAAVRRRLGVRTLFNWLGPLVNPARAPYQLLGVGRPELLDPMAGALARLGIRRALLVCGRDGLDEVSLTGPTLVREVRGDAVTAWEWTPEDFGLAPCSLEELHANGAEASAAMMRRVLAGEDGPALRVVLANAGAALFAAERVASPREGVDRAAAAVAAGAAARVLDGLIAESNATGKNEEPTGERGVSTPR